MPTTLPFGTQLVGQTENALDALLDRELAGTELSSPQRWVTLTVVVMTGGAIDRDQLVSRVAGALKLSQDDAAAHVDALVESMLLGATEGARSEVQVTDDGRELHTRIRTAVGDITNRLWGDIPEADLAVAGRVLSTVLSRANLELSPAGERGT
jgi:DNA-binding MarR family transcriptional regulator